jgi:hypothetical protein
MQATHSGEFVQDPSSFLPAARAVPSCQRSHQLVSCRHADPPHLRPADVARWGANQMRQQVRPREHLRRGNATSTLIVALQWRPCGRLIASTIQRDAVLLPERFWSGPPANMVREAGIQSALWLIPLQDTTQHVAGIRSGLHSQRLFRGDQLRSHGGGRALKNFLKSAASPLRRSVRAEDSDSPRFTGSPRNSGEQRGLQASQVQARRSRSSCPVP